MMTKPIHAVTKAPVAFVSEIFFTIVAICIYSIHWTSTPSPTPLFSLALETSQKLTWVP